MMTMRKIITSGLLLAGLLSTGAIQASAGENNPPIEPTKAQASGPLVGGTTADHTKFEALQQVFASGPAVTEACLSCHTEAAAQVMSSIHWTMEYLHRFTGQMLGKRTIINSFCGTVISNEPRCTSCHVGYGWVDMKQPPPDDESKVDCLVCHDTTGEYVKWEDKAGHPLYEPEEKGGKLHQPPNLTHVARHIGMPQRENCGSCHFYGGGGDNVKHGDLSSALVNPDRSVDVHMATDGLNFSCPECHIARAHRWPGSRYAVRALDPEGTGKPGQRRDVATCESCHGTAPHPNDSLSSMKLNHHVASIACQTCHIPAYAKGGVATKTFWDWSTAGKMKDGKPHNEHNYVQGDGKRLPTYQATKGGYKWDEDVQPHYAWFDGQIAHTLVPDRIDPTEIVEVNRINGSRGDGRSRIWPFKRMEGRQAYDKVSNTLVYNQVWGPTTDTAYWTNFDWTKAITEGMSRAGLPFSGEHGFVDTYMYWPITHMVAPKEDALACAECHAKDGRLSEVGGVYIPGRDSNRWIDVIGLLLVFGTLVGVIGHGLIRKITSKEGQ